MSDDVLVRLFATVGVCLVLAGPSAAQGSSPADSLRGKFVGLGGPLGSEQGMSVLASLASLEVSTAPLGTSTGGFTFNFDPRVRVWTRSASTFGPSFAERSLTTGRGKVSAGFNWLSAAYDSFNGQDLFNFDFQPARNILGFDDSPAHSAVALSFSTQTIVAYGHIGVTDNFDLGVAIPWIRVDVEAQGQLVGASGKTVAVSSIPETTASGIGDVALFGKYRFVSQGNGGLAAALEVRLPTGDRNSLRGLDVTRTMVALIWSRGGRVSPHVNVGYEFWFDEVPISTTGDIFAKDQFKYAVGVEFEMHPRATVVLDVIGKGLRNGGAVGYRTVSVEGGFSIDALLALPEGIHQMSIVPGIKWNVWGSVLITANLLTSLANDGLRADTIPVVGVDWAF